jgi:hypothetical protein
VIIFFFLPFLPVSGFEKGKKKAEPSRGEVATYFSQILLSSINNYCPWMEDHKMIYTGVVVFC